MSRGETRGNETTADERQLLILRVGQLALPFPEHQLQREVPVSDFESKLKVFKASKSKDFPEFLIVWCQREECPGFKAERPFLVHKRTWMRPIKMVAVKTNKVFTMIGRSCPYCYCPSRLPRPGEIR